MSKRGSTNAIRFASKSWESRKKKSGKSFSKNKVDKQRKKVMRKLFNLNTPLRQFSMIYGRIGVKESKIEINKYRDICLNMEDAKRKTIRNNVNFYISYTLKHNLSCTLKDYFENIEDYTKKFNNEKAIYMNKKQ